MKMELIILLFLSVAINATLIWYLRKVVGKLRYIALTTDDLLAILENYKEHLTNVYDLETYYGDETLQNLLEHSKAVAAEIGEYANMYSMPIDLEQETEETEEREEEVDTAETTTQAL